MIPHSSLRVYSLCDRSLRAVEPWARAGYDCIAIDIQPPLRSLPGVRHFQADLKSLHALPGAAFVMAWPPCTHLALSGARHWASKGPGLALEAVQLVEACRRLAGAVPLLLENPHGRLGKFWRKADLVVQPWHFAGYSGEEDAYQKATCLWLENGALPPLQSPWTGTIDVHRVHAQGESKARATRRSLTPRGLAEGIFRANQVLVATSGTSAARP